MRSLLLELHERPDAPLWERVRVARQARGAKRVYVFQLYAGREASGAPVWACAVPTRAEGSSPPPANRIPGAQDDLYGVHQPGIRLDCAACAAYGMPAEAVDEFRRGVRVEFDSPPPAFFRGNYRSAEDAAEAAHADIVRLRERWLEGPLDHRPHVVLPLGAVIKEREDGTVKTRLVVDATRGGLNAELGATYVKLDGLDDLIAELEPDDYLSKFDLSDAFFHLPLTQAQAEYFGIQDPLTGEFYRYRYYPFGLASAPKAMQRLARLIVTLLNAHGLRYVPETLPDGAPNPAADPHTFKVAAAYLDDFGMRHAATLTPEQARQQFDSVLRVLADIGAEAKPEKCEPPRRSFEYLGFEVSSDTKTVGVTASRKAKLRADIADFLARPGLVTGRRDLAALIGKLQYVAAFVDSGQQRLVRPYRARDAFVDPRHASNPAAVSAWAPRVQVYGLTAEVRSDLAAFADSLGAAAAKRIYYDLPGGTAFWRGQCLDSDEYLDATSRTSFGVPVVTGDASGYGVGAHFDVHRFQHWLPDRLCSPNTSSNYRELYVVYLSLLRWSPRWRGERLLVRSDNSTTVALLNGGCTSSDALSPLLARVRRLAQAEDIDIRARHIAGKANVLADTLSRLRLVNDRDDWQLSREAFDLLERRLGPHEVDAACDPSGHNAQLARFWSAADDALRQSWQGLNVYVNPPFSLIKEFVLKALSEFDLDRQTAVTMIVPDWPQRSWARLVARHFRVVTRYPAGTDLFTRRDPRAPSAPIRCGPTRWPVCVVRLDSKQRRVLPGRGGGGTAQPPPASGR